MKKIKISDHASVYQNGINCVIIEKNGVSCLINCSPQMTPQLINSLDLDVKMIICLNYRSSVNGGIVNLSKTSKIAAPESQLHLFSSPMQRLGDEKYRLHVYDFHPDNDIINNSADIAAALSDGSVLDFEGIQIEFFEVKGDTDGELGCIIHDGAKIGVCADIVCGGGKIPFLYRLCKDSGGFDDYHAFLVNKDDLLDSLRKFNSCDMLIPARGEAIKEPLGAVETLAERLGALYENYASVSALNYYSPGYLKPSAPMTPAKTAAPPENIKYLFCNYIIISENKRGFLVDCGTQRGFDMLAELFASGELEAVDICYITHYHHDHTDWLDKLQELYKCKIYAAQSMADMLENPEAYYITCLSNIGVSPEILPDNHTFVWEGYNFSHFEFPGQTLYHGGLLFDGGNARFLFCGDSFAPTGFDDYCPQNRNFTGGRRGFRRCLDIIENLNPDYIINQHQEQAFIYGQKELAFLRNNLEERYSLMRDLTLWDSPDYSLDPYWARMYPYVSRVKQGGPCVKEMQFTNHTDKTAQITVKFSASAGISVPEDISAVLPPLTSGLKNQVPADICVPISFQTAQTEPGTYSVGAEIWLNDAYFGEICKGVIFIDI